MAESLRLDHTDYSLPGRGLEIDGPATLVRTQFRQLIIDPPAFYQWALPIII
jgi:hypothetical protein